jgi:hypothetical protein|tara:strand:- start:903 stop:1178 length:276 start_codon:yes stop_codon:yes gene_type:complete
MPTCLNCDKAFPIKIIIDGKFRNLQRRKYCLICSPFGSGNTKKLHCSSPDRKDRKKRDALKYKKWQQKARKERKQKLVDMLGGKCIHGKAA